MYRISEDKHGWPLAFVSVGCLFTVSLNLVFEGVIYSHGISYVLPGVVGLAATLPVYRAAITNYERHLTDKGRTTEGGDRDD